jgi:hypothetical protein
LNGFSYRPKLLIIAACLILGGCNEGEQRILNEAQIFLNQWFELAAKATPEGSEPSCHGYGELMFPAATCLDMHQHAKLIDPSSRTLERMSSLECFGSGQQRVCGDFVEIWYASKDATGRAIKEGAVVKRDDGKYRLYWYRSDLLFTTLENRAEQAAELSNQIDPAQTLLQSSYNQVVAAHPELYQYPPCLDDIRISSSTMIGEPIKPQNVEPTDIHQRAEQCADEICFALLGQKITALCPRKHHD